MIQDSRSGWEWHGGEERAGETCCLNFQDVWGQPGEQETTSTVIQLNVSSHFLSGLFSKMGGLFPILIKLSDHIL